MSTREGKIYEAISNVMKDIGAVGKNNTNAFDKYKFRGIDDVMNALSPAMVKNKVFVTPEVIDSTREERSSKDGKTNMMYTILTVKYTFYTDDGSSVECIVIGEAMDRSDKSTNKAMSAAFKYACFQTFCIPTEEMQDADAESPEIGKKTTKVKKETKSEEQLNQEMIDSTDKTLIPSKGAITPEHITKIKAEIERTGIAEIVILSMFKVKSVEEMTDVQAVSALNKFAKTPNKKDVE